MGSYTIGEVAQRTGFTASALRYYEDIGLVAPAARSTAGYRLYGEHSLARLAFIARAKQLGCSLEEIADLVAIWDGEQCGPVQRRFHELITGKIAETQLRLADLSAFVDQLREAAARLDETPLDGPCGPGCACLADPPGAPSAPLTLGAKPAEMPIACTLEPSAMPDRFAEWEAQLARVRARGATAEGRLRLEFDDDVSVTELASLVAAEQHCCAFLAFAITIDHRGVGLEVDAPDGAGGIVAALFEARDEDA